MLRETRGDSVNYFDLPPIEKYIRARAIFESARKLYAKKVLTSTELVKVRKLALNGLDREAKDIMDLASERVETGDWHK